MIGYKIALAEDNKRVLVTLEIPDDANTNIDRGSVKCKEYAKYRCDKARVIDIEDTEGNKYSSANTCFYNGKSLEYILWEEVVEPSYNKNKELVCTKGIHFFISKKLALLFELNKVDNGEYIRCYDNGQLEIQCYYVDGILHGEYKEWFRDGQIKVRKTYVNGKIDGDYKIWHYNGQLKLQLTYVNCERNGEHKIWNKEGLLVVYSNYIDNKSQGEFMIWYDNGKLKRKYTYVDDTLHGEYKQWDEEGKLIVSKKYNNGVKVK